VKSSQLFNLFNFIKSDWFVKTRAASKRFSANSLIFVNTAFGIWCLSTLAVGSLGAYYTHFEQCVHDADKMKDDYYKLVHELRLRRARLAAALQGDALDPSKVPQLVVSQEYKDKSYMELYWQLREIQDSMDFTGNEKVLQLLTDYRSDGFGELFMQAELPKPISIPEGLKAKDVASSDMAGVRLSGPLKRHCNFFEVVSLMGGGTPHVLYIDRTSNNQQKADPGQPAQAAVLLPGVGHWTEEAPGEVNRDGRVPALDR
jgi:hypothetical protein